MIKPIVKTIVAAVLALSASSAWATMVTQVTAPGIEIPAATDSFAAARLDIGAVGVDGSGSGSFLGWITNFDFTFTVPKELQLVRANDVVPPADAGLFATTNSTFATDSSAQGTRGQVIFFAGTPGTSTSARLQGIISPNLGIDILDLLFSTTAPGVYDVTYMGEFTYFDAANGLSTATTSGVNGAFQISVIPSPASGILFLSGAGNLLIFRRRRRT